MGRNELVLAVGVVLAGGLLLARDRLFAVGLAVALAAFAVLWLVSLALRDASIVDIFWGVGCAGAGWLYTAVSPFRSWIGLLVCVLATIWAVRLAAHIAVRNAGSGEDYRYRQWRERSGAAFWWVSLFKVFLLQAVVLWVVSSPLGLAQEPDPAPASPWLVAAGVLLWLVGLGFETVADWQLVAFAREPANRGRVLSSGLWGLSRHPNYFGEALLWWGIGVIALSVAGPLALAGPAVLTFTLVKISGVAMLDRELVSRRPGYAEYIETTPAFLPVPRALRRSVTRG